MEMASELSSFLGTIWISLQMAFDFFDVLLVLLSTLAASVAALSGFGMYW